MAKDTFSSLRTKIDGREGFASGHQVINTTTAAPGGHGHGAAQHAARMKKVPVWVLDDVQVRESVKKRFPNMDIDQEQKNLAMRMIRVLHLYYRVGLTASAVAEAIGTTTKAVTRIVERTRKKPSKSGRPKKGGDIGTSNEDRNKVDFK